MRALFFLVFLALFSFASFAVDCQQGDQQACGYPDAGECRSGVQLCENGFWSMCYGGNGPVDELCGDGKDNDCDGETDEQCTCASGETRECGPSEIRGVCLQGTETCLDGEWGPCEGAVFPFPSELCGLDGAGNGEDDDCNGQVDEGCPALVPTSSVTCFNGVLDADEDDVDCGGSCKKCASCDDRVLNQGEEKVSQNLGNGVMSDCGGPNCPVCPTCFDNKKNQGEGGVDCGGPCATPCDDLLPVDTDTDGIPDARDPLPFCPDGVCQKNQGETSSNCEDCTRAFPVAFVLLAFFVVAGVVAYWWLKRKKPVLSSSAQQKQPYSLNAEQYRQISGDVKKRPTPLDTQLEKSFEKIDRFLKK